MSLSFPDWIADYHAGRLLKIEALTFMLNESTIEELEFLATSHPQWYADLVEFVADAPADDDDAGWASTIEITGGTVWSDKAAQDAYLAKAPERLARDRANVALIRQFHAARSRST